MTESQPILDYASPRPRGKARLPARSELEIRTDAESVEVIERLTGKAGAIAAIVFAGLMFLLMSVQAYVVFKGLIRHDYGIGIPAAIVMVVLVGGLWVMAAVVNNTWRRTILTANADGIRLRFIAPITGRQIHAWDARQRWRNCSFTRLAGRWRTCSRITKDSAWSRSARESAG